MNTTPRQPSGDDEDNAPSQPLGDGHLPDITDVIAKGELPVIDADSMALQGGDARHPQLNTFRMLVTEVLNIDPKLRGHYKALMKLGPELEPVWRLSGRNPRRNAERKLVKAHGFRQFKKARQVARFILREQTIREQAAKEML